MYELIVIGAGPAGITAAVYAARKKLDLLVITKDIGGQAAWSSDVENYTGYQFISGADLAGKFEDHMRGYDLSLKEGESVLKLEKGENSIKVITDKQEYLCRALVIASGKSSRQLGVSGEKEFRNKGITYCATCDGPLFSGKDVAVVGGGNSALDAALQLTKIAAKVFIINNTPSLGGDAVMREKVIAAKNVTVFNSSLVTAVSGGKFVDSLEFKREGRAEKIAVQGVFVEIGLVPNSGFAGIVERNASGEIKVDCHNRTSTDGVFAAGDVTDVPEKQIIIAAGEGAKAALGAFRYLARSKF